MATGTGQNTPFPLPSLNCSGKTENARRVLFLVDRLELEDQALRKPSCVT